MTLTMALAMTTTLILWLSDSGYDYDHETEEADNDAWLARDNRKASPFEGEDDETSAVENHILKLHFIEKIVGFSGIQTRIVRVDGEQADQ